MGGSLSPPGREGKEQGCGPDVLALPDSPASLCSLRMEMERIQEEQSKVRQDPGQAGVMGEAGSADKTLTRPCFPLCLPQAKRQEVLRPSQGTGRTEEVRIKGGTEGVTLSRHPIRDPSSMSCAPRPSSQTCSRSSGQRCCGCRRSWRLVSRCSGISYDCPRPCRYRMSLPHRAGVTPGDLS